MTAQNSSRLAPIRSLGHEIRTRSPGRAGRLVVTILMLISLYYVAYRYPFQVGDGVLSPNYSATPVWLQTAKYAILALLIPFGLLILRKDKVFSSIELMIIAFSASATLYCIIFAFSNLAMATRLFEIGFIPFIAIILANPSNFSMEARKFINMVKTFFWINLLVYVVQFVLFWFFGRMPGLAFGGATTRFGGIWDDPNSALAPFAIYVPYWLVSNGIGWRGGALVIITLISIIIAQSVTSLIAIIFAAPILIMFFRKQWSENTQRRVIIAASLTIAIISLAVLIIYLSGTFDLRSTMRELDLTLGMKAESASQRADSYSLLNKTSILTVFGLSPLFAAGENQFVNVFANFGILMLAIFVAIHLQILYYLYRWTRGAHSRESYSLAVGCSCYFIWYFVSMINIPKAEVFPVNLLAAVVAGLAIAARKGIDYKGRRPDVGLPSTVSVNIAQPILRKPSA